MDFDLTDEQQLIRSTAREFTDREIVEQAKQKAATTTMTWAREEDRRPGLPRGDRATRMQ